MPRFLDAHSPYKTANEAAAYIKKGLSTFRNYVRQYNIPRHGPAKDRYHIDDLESFMLNCNCFLEATIDIKREDRFFTPVNIEL